jgi:hypothetical protein
MLRMFMKATAIRPDESLLPAAHRDHFVEALSRILASRAFAKSARLSAFLRYVCMTTLEGREKVLCEQHIGIAVFGRPDHYNPSDDTIVRSSARLLRQRLAMYYEQEGAHEEFRITIPRGSYVPVLADTAPAVDPTATGKPVRTLTAQQVPREADIAVEMYVEKRDAGQAEYPAEPLPAGTPNQPAATVAAVAARPLRRRWLAAALAFCSLLALACWYQLRIGDVVPDASDRFWAAMLPADRDTSLIVADNGLVMYQSDVHRQVPLSDYASNDHGGAGDPTATGGQAGSLVNYGARRYTAMSSVTLAAEIGKRARAAPQRYHVRFARDVQLGDLKHGNSILVGVEHSNPWWGLYRKQFNFHIDWDPVSGGYTVRNDRPAQGEQAAYAFSGRDPGRRGYALIGLKRNLSGDGRTLLLGGTTSAGTDAAIEFLSNPASMAPLMKRAERPDGTLADFEVLLQCVLQANGSTDIQLLGLRVE